MQEKKNCFGEVKVIRDMAIDYDYSDWDDIMTEMENESLELWADHEIELLLNRQIMEEAWEMENDPDYWDYDNMEMKVVERDEYFFDEDKDADSYWDEVEEQLNAKADRREAKKETMPMDGRGLITNNRPMNSGRKSYKKERKARERERWNI
jgi:hypothetical protein